MGATVIKLILMWLSHKDVAIHTNRYNCNTWASALLVRLILAFILTPMSSLRLGLLVEMETVHMVSMSYATSENLSVITFSADGIPMLVCTGLLSSIGRTSTVTVG